MHDSSTSPVKVRSNILIGLIIAAILFCGYFFAKWNFANAVSSRTDDPNIAKMAVDLSPSDPQTHFALGTLLDKSFDPADSERSLAELREAVRLGPHSYFAWIALARSLEMAGEDVEARKAFDNAFSLASEYADVQWAYGNMLLRNGETQSGFDLISKAATAKPALAASAVSFAYDYYDGDLIALKKALGESAAIQTALAQRLANDDRLDDALAQWQKIPKESQSQYSEITRSIANKALEEKHYRTAAAFLASDGNADVPVMPETVTDGGFEYGVKLRGAAAFDWQLADGSEPQVTMSSSQFRSGSRSLWIVFNTTKLADFRTLQQTIAVIPNKRYTFSAFYRSELRGDSTVYFEISDAMSGKTLGQTSPFSMNADWAAATAQFQSPADSDGITVKLLRQDCGGPAICKLNGRLWLDDVSITTTDNP